MAEIQLPFLEKFHPKILNGTKTATSRTKRYGKEGDYFVLGNTKFEIIKVRKMLLCEVFNNLLKEEGVEDEFEFINTWKKLHPRKGYEPFQEVFVHFFRRSEN